MNPPTLHRDWRGEVEARLAAIDAEDRRRTIRDFDAHGVSGTLNGREVVSFASNDYLGLTAHPALASAAAGAAKRWGTGSGASRLVVGARPIHRELERDLAVWRDAEAALLFPTGFAANLGVLTCLGGPDVAIYSDELNHASIIDGTRLARGAVRVWRHTDLAHLDALLTSDAGQVRPVIVTDTVFSMDGDVADLDGLVALAARHGAALVLDEAHAVLGPAVPAVPDELLLLRVGTLSKALGAVGGFVTGPTAAINLLLNTARSFIFTTAPTPASAAAGVAAVRLMRSDDGAALIARLREHVDRLLPGHPSPILPVRIGAEADALAASAALLERGLLVPAIRPPTVAPGTSRLRIALSAAHTDEQVDHLQASLSDLGLQPGLMA